MPKPAKFTRNVSEVLAMVFGSNYDALCRSAILLTYWHELDEAEKKINMAKHKNNGKAFAHHAYGLLRGVQGNRGGARFELGLALDREPYAGARQRIRRGLALCDNHHLT